MEYGERGTEYRQPHYGRFLVFKKERSTGDWESGDSRFKIGAWRVESGEWRVGDMRIMRYDTEYSVHEIWRCDEAQHLRQGIASPTVQNYDIRLFRDNDIGMIMQMQM
jgi:hypothetical protein